MCDDYGRCSGIMCPDHPLLSGLVRDLYDADSDGLSWGDIVVSYDAKILAEETPSERILRMLRQSEADQKSMHQLMDYKTQKYTNRCTGKMLMAKINLPCRYANAPQSTDKHGVVCPANWQPGGNTIVPDQKSKMTFFETEYGAKSKK